MSLDPKIELQNTFNAASKAVKEESEFYMKHKEILDKHHDLETVRENALSMLSFLCHDVKMDDKNFAIKLENEVLTLILYEDNQRITLVDHTVEVNVED